jgi:hypothetical protein
MKTKIGIFTALLVVMVSYVVWIFNMSEPKYIDNPNRVNEVKKYDIVSVRPYNNIENSLKIGMALQVDTTSFKNNHYAVVKSLRWSDGFMDIVINSKTPRHKIIGKGTFYHKVNYFIGFNIMMTTTVIIMIICIVLLVTLIRLLREFFRYNPIFD